MTNEQKTIVVRLNEGDKVYGSYHGGAYSGIVTRFSFSDKDDAISAFVMIDAPLNGLHGITREAGETIIIRTNQNHSTIGVL